MNKPEAFTNYLSKVLQSIVGPEFYELSPDDIESHCNVVSALLIHGLRGAAWFKQSGSMTSESCALYKVDRT